MKLIKTLLFIFLTAILGTLQAQDIHYSLYNMSPLTLNPGLTGSFYGTVRVGGIYRGQWYNVSDATGFETPSFYADAPIIRGFRDKDWVGVGLAVFNDKAGSVKLRTNASLISAAYHLGLGKAGNSVLTLGLQGGSVSRRFSQTRLQLADQWDASTGQFGETSQDDMIAGDGRNKATYVDFAGGLLFRTKNKDGAMLELGASAHHVTQPNESFLSSGGGTGGGNKNVADENKRPFLINAHAKYEWMLTDKWSAAPTAFFQTTRGAKEIALQAWGGYLLNPEQQIKLHFGLGYRFSDAAQILAGLDYKDLRVALSYDVNTSSLNTATNYQGAFEIAAWYILKIYKEPEVKQTILCPKF
ncbi:MAG: PorP/SprF family type IX secretion system membrane protein [Phaeodactylibacter sp.]|nr:PorP/SprF family type IX secretion system membrane protein [Phaeodactylibacter sp.]